MAYKLNEDERTIIATLLIYSNEKKEELDREINARGDSEITIEEFESDLKQVRYPLTTKDFKSDFLDKVLALRLDTFNPTKYLAKNETKVKLSKYLFMIDLNVRVLSDLDLEAMKGNLVN